MTLPCTPIFHLAQLCLPHCAAHSGLQAEPALVPPKGALPALLPWPDETLAQPLSAAELLAAAGCCWPAAEGAAGGEGGGASGSGSSSGGDSDVGWGSCLAAIDSALEMEHHLLWPSLALDAAARCCGLTQQLLMPSRPGLWQCVHAPGPAPTAASKTDGSAARSLCTMLWCFAHCSGATAWAPHAPALSCRLPREGGSSAAAPAAHPASWVPAARAGG